MNPLSLVADCDTVSLTGDAVDPGAVRWALKASRTRDDELRYEVTLLTTYEHYDPFPGPGREATGRPDGDPPEGLYCLAAVVAEYLEGATLHVSGPLRQGWPPRPIQEAQNSRGEPIPGTQVYAVPESANLNRPPTNADALGIDWSGTDPTAPIPFHKPQPWPDAMAREGFEEPQRPEDWAAGTWHLWDRAFELGTYLPRPPWARPEEPEIVLRGARTQDEVNLTEWRDAVGTLLYPPPQAKVWGVLVWPRRTDNARRVDEYADRDIAERMIRTAYGRNVILVWRHETSIRLDDEAVWHSADCDGTHGHTEPQCDAYLLGPLRRVPVGETRQVGVPPADGKCQVHGVALRANGTCPEGGQNWSECGRDLSSAQFTVDDAHRHPHGMPETWDDAGGCAYPGCPVAKLPERCHVDMGAARLGGPRIACGKPLPCPEHTITPATQAPTDIAQPPAQCSHGYTHGHNYAASTDRTQPMAWCDGPQAWANRLRDHAAGQHTETPDANCNACRDFARANSTQGQAAEMRTQQEPQAESDVRAPAPAHEATVFDEFRRLGEEHRLHGSVPMPTPTGELYMAAFWRDAARVMGEEIDRRLDEYVAACPVVVYAGSGSPGAALRVCGKRRPCPEHETVEVEHDETCQHDDEPAEASEARRSDYCGFEYPHQPHTWMPKPPRIGTSLECPGKEAPSLYDGPREGVNT